LFASSRRISAYFFPTLLASSVIAYPVPAHSSFEDISILSPCGSVFSYPSSTASISHVIFIPLLPATPFSGLCGPRLLAIRSPCRHYCGNRTDLWASLTPLYPAQQQLYMASIPRPLSVFVPCFLDVLPCASRLCLSYTYDVYALISLGLLLRIGDSFHT